jgi:lantibiotic biosynthesis protein
MGWNPLLTGSIRDTALERATALTRMLAGARATDQRSASLAAGSAGVAVCHAVVARSRQDERAREVAIACLDSATEVLASQPLSLSLYSGFPGIAWAADLVGRMLPGGTPDRLDDIDHALAGAVRRYPKSGPYDLIDGLTGLGLYSLARWPRPAAAECLTGVLEQLAARARSDVHGVYWWTSASDLVGPRRERYLAGGVDVGMAHGMAGVIPLLARACALGIGGPTLRGLLDGAVEWLLGHLVDSAAGPTVPSFVAAGAEPGPTRSAWCYGDPGVAAALLLAARDVREPRWELAGTELALRAAMRAPEHSGVRDGGLCHGSAGLAHLFARMHELTGRPELADAALAWLHRTLAACTRATHAAGAEPGATVGQPGRSAVRPVDRGGDLPLRLGTAPPWNGPGLLEGAAGVALVLLAACLPEEPAWDQMLFVSSGLPTAVSA